MSNLLQIVSQLQEQREQVQKELARLDAAIQALGGASVPNGSRKIRLAASQPRRTMSAAGRRKIAAAQKARWAAWKAKRKKAA